MKAFRLDDGSPILTRVRDRAVQCDLAVPLEAMAMTKGEYDAWFAENHADEGEEPNE
jgi:hypothetical protein